MVFIASINAQGAGAGIARVGCARIGRNGAIGGKNGDSLGKYGVCRFRLGFGNSNRKTKGRSAVSQNRSIADEEKRGEGKRVPGRPEGQRDIGPYPCRIAHGEGQRRNVRRRHEAPAA